MAKGARFTPAQQEYVEGLHGHIAQLLSKVRQLETQLAEARELLSADRHDRLTGSWEARRNALLGEETE